MINNMVFEPASAACIQWVCAEQIKNAFRVGGIVPIGTPGFPLILWSGSFRIFIVYHRIACMIQVSILVSTYTYKMWSSKHLRNNHSMINGYITQMIDLLINNPSWLHVDSIRQVWGN